MSGWIFARGKENEQTLTGAVSAGAKTIALDGASDYFAVGETLMIAGADGAAAEWLGAVRAVSDAGVTFTRELRAAKNAGATLWKPAASLASTSVEELPGSEKWSGGVAIERSLSGEVYAVETGVDQRTMTMILATASSRATAELVAWLREETLWGLEPFTMIDPRGAMLAARFTDAPLKVTRLDGGRRKLELSLEIIGEEIYR